ncbi:MAG: hypothetical protein E2O96_01445 [Acidobacteria bacterium]|nr:MAG: hypothetical protein E2O96_01445 [Acidobacteriota bacterium]
MDETEWRVATDELRQALGSEKVASDRFDVIDLVLPMAGGGIEVMVGFDESHLPSKTTGWLFALQDKMAMRSSSQQDVVGIYISAHRIPADMLAEALARMRKNDVIPLTLQQAKTVAAQDGDLIDILGPIRGLVEVAASRSEDDLENAADALLNQIEILVEQYAT